MTKAMREARGWTQEHLAVVTGLSVRTIQRVEAGEAPAAETVISLAAAFDVTPQELVDVIAHVVPMREWTEVVTVSDEGPYRVQSGPVQSGSSDRIALPMPVGPLEVRRFHFTFPSGECPAMIVDRPSRSSTMVVGSEDGLPLHITIPRRVIFPTFTEADLRGDTFERRIAHVVAAFHFNGFDDARPGTALAQVTWLTLAVGDEPVMHSIAATHFSFGAEDLRFIASLNVIRHARVQEVRV